MLKLLGSVCVFLAAWAAGLTRLRSGRRRLALLRGLVSALERMDGEIRLNRTPMFRLLGRLAEEKGPESLFFQVVLARTEGGEDLPAVWREAVEELDLPEQAASALAELGDRLTGDEEQASRSLRLTGGILRDTLEELRRGQPEAERRGAALWFSGAALLVILLI